MANLDHHDFGRGAVSFLKSTAALISSIVVVGAASWWLLSPRLDDYMSQQNQAAADRLQAIFDERLTAIEDDMASILRTLNTTSRPSVEFLGGAPVITAGATPPGGAVEVMYQVRRNRSCSSVLQVRFFDVVKHAIDTSLTYEIPVTEAPITRAFAHFVVTVRLPREMSDGHYIYAPLIVSSCDEMNPVVPPMSGVFEVRSD